MGLAFLIAVLYFTNAISGTTAIILALLGIVFVLTSLVNWCPLYHVLGISTYPKKGQQVSTGNPKPV